MSSTNKNKKQRAEQQDRRPRGAKYTSAEIDKLLDLVEERLPTGGEDWDGSQLIFLIISSFLRSNKFNLNILENRIGFRIQ